jgi:hypothetical protein
MVATRIIKKFKEVEIHWNNYGGLGGRRNRGLGRRKGREGSCEEEETHSPGFLFFFFHLIK